MNVVVRITIWRSWDVIKLPLRIIGFIGFVDIFATRSADVYRPNDGSVAKTTSKAPLRVETRTREMAVLRPEC